MVYTVQTRETSKPETARGLPNKYSKYDLPGIIVFIHFDFTWSKIALNFCKEAVIEENSSQELIENMISLI